MSDAGRLLRAYPRIFLACHVEHRRDPATRRVLSDRQASILDHLDDVQALRLTDLARHMGVTPATMSVAVGRLVRDGYVRRGHDARDRRAVRLRLTAAGRRMRDAAEVLDAGLAANLLGRLTVPQRRAALDGLEHLARAADRLMTERSEKGTWMNRRTS
jgi:DNA-binding MarR family transcriptional regulator